MTMARSNRRKGGKQGGRHTPTNSTTTQSSEDEGRSAGDDSKATANNSNDDDDDDDDVDDDDNNNNTNPGREEEATTAAATNEASAPAPDAPIHVPTAAAAAATPANPASVATNAPEHSASNRPTDLILTSEKRRGVYECDYCHTDISQHPRIRCAICPDFDLCLDCFTTTDHATTVARMKAAVHTQSELEKDTMAMTTKDDDATSAAAAAGEEEMEVESTLTSVAGLTHEAYHGYRVCDSTRYPIFPTGRVGEGGGVSLFVGRPGASAAASTSSVRSFRSTTTTAPTPSSKEATETSGEIEENQTPKDEKAIDSGDKDKMDVDEDNQKPVVLTKVDSEMKWKPTASEILEISVTDDPKVTWTAEEDLRLIEGVKSHGLGNWTDISEVVGGNGSSGKTPKRCMERYFDDFLGRYGHIVPKYTVIEDDQLTTEQPETQPDEALDATAAPDTTENTEDDADTHDKAAPPEGNDEEKQKNTSTIPSTPTPATGTYEDEGIRSSKRKGASSRLTPSILAAATMRGATSSAARKKIKVIPTESIPNYSSFWPRPFLPTINGVQVQMGQEIARDLSTKAEQAFFKAIMAANTKEEADRIREEYIAKYKDRPIGAPTVLPPRPDDAAHLPGAELAGYMPRRGDFDIEWDNDAENSIADMEFSRGDTPQEKALKLKVLDIYYQKQEEREKRKNFILTRHLYDYRKYIEDDQKLPNDERDLIHRMRLFERFHTAEEHRKFIEDLLKAKRLRKEIAKLQMYRRMGIRSLAEAEKYELDKGRRQFHKTAQALREQEAKAKSLKSSTSGTSRPSAVAAAAASGLSAATVANQIAPPESLWKQYRSNDRKFRRNSSRLETAASDGTAILTEGDKNDELPDKPRIGVASVAPDTAAPASKDQGGVASGSTATTVLAAAAPRALLEKESSAMEVDVDEKKRSLDEEGEDSITNAASTLEIASDFRIKKGEISKDNAGSEMATETTTPLDIAKQDDDMAEKPMDTGENEAKEDIKDAGQTPLEDDDKQPGKKEQEFDISGARGRELLSRNEAALCQRLQIYPIQYLKVKKALIHESLMKGLLDKSSSSRRTICMIDVIKRGSVIDFLVRAGWVDSKLGHVAKTIAPLPVVEPGTSQQASLEQPPLPAVDPSTSKGKSLEQAIEQS